MKTPVYIALDLGTKCGWAVGAERDGKLAVLGSGTWNLKPGHHQSAGHRLLKLQSNMKVLAEKYTIAAVVIEEVHRHKGTIAAHVYGGLLNGLQAWCAERDILVTSFGVGQIKSAWTGKGNAKKETMILHAEVRGFKVVDDNHADALAILHLAADVHGLPAQMMRDTGIAAGSG